MSKKYEQTPLVDQLLEEIDAIIKEYKGVIYFNKLVDDIKQRCGEIIAKCNDDYALDDVLTYIDETNDISLGHLDDIIKNRKVELKAELKAEQFKKTPIGKMITKLKKIKEYLENLKLKQGDVKDNLLAIDATLTEEEEDIFQELEASLEASFEEESELSSATTEGNRDALVEAETEELLNEVNELMEAKEKLEKPLKEKSDEKTNKVFSKISSKISTVCEKIYALAVSTKARMEISSEKQAREMISSGFLKMIQNIRNPALLIAAKKAISKIKVKKDSPQYWKKASIEDTLNRRIENLSKDKPKPPSSIAGKADEARESVASSKEGEEKEAQRDSDVSLN